MIVPEHGKFIKLPRVIEYFDFPFPITVRRFAKDFVDGARRYKLEETTINRKYREITSRSSVGSRSYIGR